MKFFLVTVFTVFTFTFASAQEEAQPQEFGFQQKDIFVEGNFGFSSSKNTNSDVIGDYNENKRNSINFNPKVGYFVTDKLAIGLRLNLISSNFESTQFTNPNLVRETKSNAFSGGLFGRYYFLELGKRFKTYTELGVIFGSSKSETSEIGNPILIDDNSYKYFNTSLDLGIQYFLTSRMAINFSLTNLFYFSSNKYKDKLNETEGRGSGFGGDLNIFNNFFNATSFGLTYKL
ncbi:PorT family protein [Flavobacterium jejuense]|uniref:PorT family protein n=1 Tax=Flavobacterium jejuense TaxID=1544455 RepID=A0ABX0ISF9_9FLAO|nr:outer membrane beta-barrel protein [Flavobacterium jejuense]NHN25046.1 PorT family protein [Flavobacterium jejuense]